MAGFVTIGKMLEFLKNKLTQIPTIAELQSRKNLKVGDIVEVLGYYTAGDGAGHKRIIKAEDDGSGVQLSNNLWACIVHNGEVNVSWLGVAKDKLNNEDKINSYLDKNFSNLIINFDRDFIINKTLILKCTNTVYKFYKNLIVNDTADTAIVFKGNDSNIYDLKLTRKKVETNNALECYKNTAVKIQEAKNLNFYNLKIYYFNKGIEIYSESTGCAYLNFFSPLVYAYYCVYCNRIKNGWTNETHWFGGRMTNGELKGKENLNDSCILFLKGSVHNFNSVCMETDIGTYRVKGEAEVCLFSGCRFEGTDKISDNNSIQKSTFINNYYYNYEMYNELNKNNNIIERHFSLLENIIHRPLRLDTNFDFSDDLHTKYVEAKGGTTITINATPGREYIITKYDDSTEEVKIWSRGGVIGKSSTYKLKNQFDTVKIIYSGNGIYNIVSEVLHNVVSPAQLNTLYHGEKMKEEGVYNDFITYMDEKTAYDKQQRKLEQDRQLAYEEALKENPNLTYEEFMSVQPMTLNLVEEPQPSQALQNFMKKYL